MGRHHIPCPGLVDDACSTYGNRPILARKYGISLWNPNKPNVLQACELNFTDGEVMKVEGLVEPRMQLEYRRLSFKNSVDEELDLPDLVPTAASAVVLDYETLLEDGISSSPTT